MPTVTISDSAFLRLKEMKQDLKENKGRPVTYSEVIENVKVKK